MTAVSYSSPRLRVRRAGLSGPGLGRCPPGVSGGRRVRAALAEQLDPCLASSRWGWNQAESTEPERDGGRTQCVIAASTF